MAIIRDRIPDTDVNREILLVGDTVKLVDSPLDRLKRGARGRIVTIYGDLATDPNALVLVEFRVAGQPFTLQTGAERFVFCKHPKGAELPDAEGSPSDSEEAE